MTIAGIDLGTTYSLISVWRHQEASIIPNALGDRLTPSVVGIDDNGELLIGKAAKERLITHPDKTIALFKRYMGSSKQWRLDGREFRPEELSSFVLRALKADAEAYLGETIDEVVISVPAYFSDAQRKATRAAGQLAGLTVRRLINEPTAAAIAYGLHQNKADATVLVFDLGGGTFDVSILEFFDGVMEVRATAGDNFLGGDDFTQLIVKHFLRQNELDPEKLTPGIFNLLQRKAEGAKRHLSSDPETAFDIYAQGRTIHWALTRKSFEELSTPLLKRLRLPIERSLLDAKLNCRQIDDVVLVGGATRMPMIRALVARLIGKIPYSRIHPDEAVALGAAIQGGLKERDAALKEIVLTDVCPYTLGVEVAFINAAGCQPGHFAPVMERGVSIPASKQERFFTLFEAQPNVEVIIYQGESRLVKDNIKLGRLVVPVPAAPAGKEAIDVRFTYTIDGILEVEVTVVSTGMKAAVVIEEAPGVLTPDQIRERLAELSALKIHPRDKIENRTLLARGERLYESRRHEGRRLIAEAIRRFESSLENQEPKAIVQARQALERLLRQIEEEGVQI
jgi:molecular chaperone HscC